MKKKVFSGILAASLLLQVAVIPVSAEETIPIGNSPNRLYSSRCFPPVHTVHDSFPSHGVPSII